MLICRVREIPHGGLRLLAEAQDLAHPEDELLPFIGEEHVLGTALDELDAQVGFQGVDGGGNGWLRDKKGISCLCEVFVLIDSVEVQKMFEIEHMIPSSLQRSIVYHSRFPVRKQDCSF